MNIPELEEIVKDPLKTFDYVNSQLWEHVNHPLIADSIKIQREKINALKSSEEQYQAVLTYILTVVTLKRDQEEHPEKVEYFLRTFCPGPLETNLPF